MDRRSQISSAPSGRDIVWEYSQGLTPLAESCSPFGTKSDSPLWGGSRFGTGHVVMDKQVFSQLRSQIFEHEHERILAKFADLPV